MKWMTVLLMVMLVVSCGKEEASKEDLMGTWVGFEDKTTEQSGLTIKTTRKMRITESSVTSITQCTVVSKDKVVSAEATAPAQIQDGQVVVLGEQSKSTSESIDGASFSCSSQIKPMVFKFKFKEKNVLLMDMPPFDDGSFISLVRE